MARPSFGQEVGCQLGSDAGVTPIGAAARAIRDSIQGDPAPADGYDFPNVDDGVAGMAFIKTAVESSGSDQKWIKFPTV